MSSRAFVILGRIVAMEWADNQLWVDTIDYTSSQDQHYPQSLSDSLWRRPPQSRGTRKANWTVASTACLICLTDELTEGYKLNNTTQKKAMAALQSSQHLHALEFMSRILESRPQSLTRAKRTK